MISVPNSGLVYKAISIQGASRLGTNKVGLIQASLADKSRTSTFA
jgi:hypothetical protein